MAYVKLDCGILDSTLWIDRLARELFITALLMAEPREITEPIEVLAGNSLVKDKSFPEVPPGWYGFVPAAGPGIIRRAGITDKDAILALQRLGAPDYQSRTPQFQGRRMVRVDGGYIILNFDKYRSKDHTAAERSRRFRERQAQRVTNVPQRVTGRSATQAEAISISTSKKQSTEEREQSSFFEFLNETDFPKEFHESTEFTEAWQAFIEHRKTIKAKLTPRASKLIGQKLKQWGLAKAILALNNTVESGKWTGVFDPDERKYGSNGKPKSEKTDWSKVTVDNAL